MSEKRIESIVDPIAIDEGRVFIGKKRAKRGDVVQDDSDVRVHDKRDIDAPVVFLHRAKDLVAVDKPAGIATVPDTRRAQLARPSRGA
jgi:23S rRNA-/tRNA-specific pseudouridylate synthase